MKRFLFDIETDNLLEDLTTAHCGVIIDIDTDEVFAYGPNQIVSMVQKLGEADELYGHNIISFDLPALEKVYPDEYIQYLSKFRHREGEMVFDTMVMSRVLWSDIKSMDFENLAKGALVPPKEPGAIKKLVGSHSLRAWGYRLGFFKGNAGGEVDFATFTPEMLEYCKRDGQLNLKLLRLIFAKLPEWESSGKAPFHIWLEHQFYRYLEYQQGFGVGFDKELAEYLCRCWDKELEKRLAEMRIMVPDFVMEEVFIPKTNNSRYGYEKGVPFTKRQVVRFNPRSNPHIVHFLTNKYKWQPASFTKPTKRFPEGQPEITYEILKNLPYREAPLLARIKLLMDRLKLVKKSQGGAAWLQVIKPSGPTEFRIFGGIIHNGTPTARCRHVNPNLGNIPSTKAIWGKTLRKLFKAQEGFSLVGIDFDALEMRCLAEVLWDYDNGAFYQMAFSGSKEDGTDPHSLNRDAISRRLEQAGFKTVAAALKGKPGREKIKTAFYAALYGAFPTKLASVVCEGLEVPKGKWKAIGFCVQQGFHENIKGLGELVRDLEAGYNKAVAEKQWPHLQMPDGRKIPIRKKSALLNSLLQTLGAILCKLACVFKLRALEQHKDFGLPGKVWRPVLHVHDETQDEVKNERQLLTEYVQLATECFAESGRHFKFRVPIVGTADVGRNWAETH